MVSIFASLLLLIHATTAKVYLNQWAVYIEGGKLVADRVAQTNGYTNLGQIGSLENYYLFEHRRLMKRSTSQARHHHTKLRHEPEVLWVEQQVIRKRVKRDLIKPSPKTSGENWNPQWTDPGWKNMWYLNKGAHGHYDMNVVEAWKQGYTGKGVVVTILDDGIERTHTDLISNYDPDASEDINSGDHDPMPRYDSTDENRHGTRCAGEVAAIANNTKCGVGVAYGASIGGVRMLDGDVSDVVEARALSLNPQHVDIYSASWGPDDNGQVVDGPARLAKAAFVKGVLEGRGGKGSIFVWASGNGGSQSDSCSCDGYTNSVFTLSVSSTSEHGNKPWYLEECSSTLTTTYSSGESYRERKIVTTDLHDRCTESHTGTSASAPIAAGLCALALEANPNLTWRDMQYIVLLTSRTTPLVDGEWVTNGVGRKVSHRYGYGVMDAGAMVDLASRWFTVPEQYVCAISAVNTESAITGKGATFRVTIDGCEGSGHDIKYLEHVQAKISLHYSRRGDLQIFLVSPSGTRSTLLSPRKNDYEGQKLRDWPFMSVFYWGENPTGEWTLIIENTGSSLNFGVLQSWQLVLFGTDVNPIKVRRRQPDVHNTTHGEACHQECNELEGCVGALASQCIKCKHYQLGKQGSECVASCPDGTYQDDVSATCMACTSPCHTCKGSSVIEDCLSCDKDFYLVQELGSCVTQCPRGYYADTQGLCLPCDDGCGVCVDSPDQCVTCNHGYLFENERCVIHCDDRSFRNELSSCELCDPSCRTCVGPTNRECILCASDMLYENGSCVPFCSFGHYEVGTPNGRFCEPCHVTCQECSGPLSDQCSQCPEPYKLKEGSCHESCGQRMYVDDHDICQHCNANCLSCHGPSATECLSCQSHKVLDGNHCVDKCREGFFESVDNTDIDDIVKQCHQCHVNCLSCYGRLSTECRSCRHGLSLDGTECVLSCSVGKYNVSGKCRPCPANCLRCVGPADNQCIACRRGSFLFNGRCLKGACPDGYYANKKQCLRCHMSCASCTGPGADSCRLCHAGYTFSNKLCVRIATTNDFDNSFCGYQEYLDNIFGSCQPCHHSCSACRGPGPDECLSCVAPFQLDHRHGDCVLCCSSTVTEHCCVCHSVSGKCATDDPHKDYPNHLASTSPTYAVSRATSSSAWLGLVVVVCLFSLTVFCLIFGLLQAHSHELLCWKQQRTLYQPVPMFYHRQGSVGVRLGKQMNTSAADSETSDEHLYQNSPTHREVT